jgi:hypothetical protein
MATPTIQQGRLITKRSAIPGTVPTVPAVDDIETFISTDIFKGELFYNIPDNILYTRDNTGIVIIASGGAPITYVYYTENTTPGSEEAKIEVIDGSDSSYVLTQPTQIEINSTDGTNDSSIIVTPTSIDTLSTDGTTNVSNVVSTTSAQISGSDATKINNITVNSPLALPGVAFSSFDLITSNVSAVELDSNNISIVSNDAASVISDRISVDPQVLGNGTGIKSENSTTGEYSQTIHTPTSIDILSSDGTDTTIVTVEPNRIRNSINLGDPSNYEKEVNITTGVVSEQMITSGVGAYTNNVQASQYYFQLNDGAGVIKRIDLDNLSNYIKISSFDGIIFSEITESPGNIKIRSDDGTGLFSFIDETAINLHLQVDSITDSSNIDITDTQIQLNSLSTSISGAITLNTTTGIGAYASDAAAGTAGLVAGDVYQTDGTGSGIFATPGILMVKQ